MGKAKRILESERRMGLYLLGALCLTLGAILVGISVFGAEDEPVRRAATPAVAPAPEPLVNEALVEAQARIDGQAARKAAEEAAAQRAKAEAKKKATEGAPREEAEERNAGQAAAERRAATEPASPVVPADTTMYLSVPKIGIYDIPVVEGTTEASLSAGAGHLSGTGYPWVPGSNTYIAGHRLGYPGTPSNHVFYDLPNLVVGDKILLTDSNGTTYTYAVSEILEVPTTDLSVTYPVTGRDMVSLQTCIENFGDYWTEGPNWLARYIVRADRVD
ncbi:MAG: class E sortase [Actinomycetota bacterium]|nr:class E sortase [Actinomycetota bacterium]